MNQQSEAEILAQAEDVIRSKKGFLLLSSIDDENVFCVSHQTSDRERLGFALSVIGIIASTSKENKERMVGVLENMASCLRMEIENGK